MSVGASCIDAQTCGRPTIAFSCSYQIVVDGNRGGTTVLLIDSGEPSSFCLNLAYTHKKSTKYLQIFDYGPICYCSMNLRSLQEPIKLKSQICLWMETGPEYSDTTIISAQKIKKQVETIRFSALYFDEFCSDITSFWLLTGQFEKLLTRTY